MVSQIRIGQQVTQRTTQQGRLQIKVVVSGRQVVNANQEDHVQYDDLTQKDDLLFGTHGTENMPRSVVVVALSVSTVFCYYVLLLLFFYGGGGEGLCCRLVCHRSNEATTEARLVFIVDEGLGTDPAVEFGGVALPFHKSLSQCCSTDSTRYTLSAGTDTFCRSGW